MPERSLLLRLPEPLALGEPAEVALEDYARTVTRSVSAEAVREAGVDGPIVALRLSGLERPPDEPACGDVIAFAKELAVSEPKPGLGWS